MKPPYFRDYGRKSDKKGNMIAKVTIPPSSTHTRVNWPKGGPKAAKSDGKAGKVEYFLGHFCQECQA